MSRRGIDCSGLVVVVYDALFDLQLPRTTADLIHAGQGVKKKNLTSGDLIFFKPEHKKRHVGIYLGRGEFAHASSSKGVMISRLDNTYWGRYYVTGRRVL
jgi:cell wall-associated NlpC family hydrolase